jgi:hypothetical protein
MTAVATPLLARQRFARSAPGDLLKRPDFWLRQWRLVLPVALFVITSIFLAPHTFVRAGGWEWLSVAVQLLAVGGAFVTARSLATLDVEHAIVIEIERKGADYLRDLKTQQRTRIDLDDLERTMMPSNPTDPAPAMIRLFQHIIKEARDRRFESSVQVMQPYREETLEDVFKLQNLQKIALWGGIFGTFIGLLHAITQATVKNIEFITIVSRMFEGLRISFSASLAGLEVAVFLGWFLLVLRKQQEAYFKQMESAVVTMLSLARNTINKDEYLAEFNQIRETVGSLTETVHGHALEIKEQTEQIRIGMARLGEAKANFDGFLKQLSEAQDTFIGDIRNLYDTISLKNLCDNLRATLTEATQLMGSRLDVALHQINTRLTDFNTVVVKLSRSLEVQAKESSGTAEKLAAQISTANNENITANRAIVARIQELQAKDTTTIGVVRSDLQELTRKLAALTAAVERVGHVATGPRSFRDFLAWLFG